MGFILKLLHGSDKLNLQSGRYCVDEGNFSPPTATRSVTYGAASVGSVAAAKERTNRAWGFEVNIVTGTSAGEAERALRELQSFLNRAGGATPLYLAYRAFDDYDYEPYFGLHGAFARYEIVHGKVEAGGNYKPAVDQGNIIRASVSLVIKPQAVFPAAKAGQATGGVFENYVGSASGRAKGTIVAEATSNVFPNPAFMNATYSTNWSATNAVASKNTDAAFVLFGDVSVRLVATSSTGRYVDSLNVGNTNTFCLSFYIKKYDSSSVSGSVSVYYGGAKVTNVVSVGNGWYWCWATFSGVASATQAGVQIANTINGPVYVDGMQLEEKSIPTPFCYGDLLGCTWAGTKNDSTSTRTAARIRYGYGDILDNVLADFTIRVVWTPTLADLGQEHYFFQDSDSDLVGYIDRDNKYNFGTSTGSTIQSVSGVTLTPGTPEVIHFVYRAGVGTSIFRNGATHKAGSTTGNATAPTWLYVGCDNAAANQVDFPINGLAVFLLPWSSDEALADYTALIQQATDGDRIDPLPWLYTVGGDSIIDNDNYVTDSLYNFGVVGGLMGDDVDIAYKLDSSNTFVLGPGVTWGSLPVSPWLFDKDILTTGGTNTLLFINGSGTADTDANGDAVTRISLSTSESSSMATAITTLGAKLLREVKGVVGYFVAKDAGTNTNVQVRLEITTGSNSETYYASAWRTLATSAAFRPFVTAELPLDFEDPILDSARKLGFRFKFKRTAGASTQNFDISHAVWLTNYAAVYTGDVGATVGVDMAYVRDRLWEGVDDASPTLTIGRRIFNRALVIRPEYLNVLMLQHTYDNYAASKTTWVTGYNLEVEQFAVTPRFDIY